MNKTDISSINIGAPSIVIPVRNVHDLPVGKYLAESIDSACEVFLVPAFDSCLLYAPLQGILTLLSSSAAEKIRGFFRDGCPKFMIEKDETLAFFNRQGLFNKSDVDDSVFKEPAKRWSPTHVTFSTTQKCTLRCTYCYAEGGRLDDVDIPREIAKGAVDLIIQNAELTGEKPSINFLGEGEATASWSEFKWIIDYFRRECAQRGIVPFVDLSTNGVFPKRRVSYISETCNGITFSLDGTKEAHDKYRVLPNGKGSFRKVVETMKAFDLVGKRYNIRSTVSSESLRSLSEFVRFIGAETKCKNIQLEPIFDVRPVTSLDTEITHPDVKLFIDNFREARKVGSEFGIELYYSGADTGRKLTFCSATSAKNFLVTARGIVTSCNEVLQPTDPRASIFQYGAWSDNEKKFVVDDSRINRLGHLNALEIDKCRGCIAKFNCAGDCYAKSAVATGDPLSSGYTYRCEITRELLKDNLLLALVVGELGEETTSKWLSC